MTRRVALPVAGGLVSLAALLADGNRFHRAWLVGFWFWGGISFGAIFVLCLHHLTGGRWSRLLRGPLEASAAALPLVAALALPVAFGLDRVYEWSRPEAIRADPRLATLAAGWLSVPFFRARATAYFALWLALAWLLLARTTGDERRRTASAPGLIALFLTGTLFSVDWVMSLEPHWWSSAFGVVQMAGMGVSALSLALASAWRAPMGRQDRIDLGNVLLAFVLFWIYVSFMQYLVVWSGNLPEEATWFLRRTRGGWGALAVGLLAVHFALPFALLLSRDVKGDPRWLGGIATGLFVVHFAEVAWTILPSFGQGFGWVDAAVPLAMDGLWAGPYFHRLEGRP